MVEIQASIPTYIDVWKDTDPPFNGIHIAQWAASIYCPLEEVTNLIIMIAERAGLSTDDVVAALIQKG